MPAQINIRMDAKHKARFDRRARLDGCSVAQVTRTLTLMYVQGMIPDKLFNAGLEMERDVFPETRGRKPKH